MLRRKPSLSVAVTAVYLLAVCCLTITWVIRGAYSQAEQAVSILTMPLGIIADGITTTGAYLAVGSRIGTIFAYGLILVAYPGAAVGNVFLARALKIWLTNQPRTRGK